VPGSFSRSEAVARDASDHEHPPQRALRLLEEGDDLVRPAVVQGTQDVLGSRLVPVELVGDVRLAVHRAPRGQGNDSAAERAANRLVQIESHPADLLYQELPAASRALVVRENGGDPATDEDVHEKGLSAQGRDGVEAVADLAQGPLDGRRLGDPALPTGDAEGRGGGELWLGEEFGQDFPGPALERPHPGLDTTVTNGDNLDRQCAYVRAYAVHRSGPRYRVPVLQRPGPATA